MTLADDRILAEIYGTQPEDGPGGARRWKRRQILATVVADGAAMAIAWFLTSLAADGAEAAAALRAFAGAVIAAALWVAVMALKRGYDSRILGIDTDEYRRVAAATCWFGAGAASLAFYAGIPLSPAQTIVATIAAAAGTLLARNAIRTWLHNQRQQGRFTKQVVVVGRPSTAAALVRHFERSVTAEMQVVGLCVDPEPGDTELDEFDLPIVGTPEDVWVQALRMGVDAIAIADTDALSASQVKALAWHLEGRGIEVMVVPAITDVAGPRIQFRLAAGLPLIYLDEPRFGVVARTLKATFDRVVAAVTLVVTAPLMLAIALAVRLSDGGPAFFRQQRVGADGKQFTIIKFRSMVVDAEDRLEAIRHLNEHDGLLFKIRDDPRITRVGRFLRRWSLDELPQFWNVLRGDMSVVGPRPPLPSEVEQYDAHVTRRLRVKPGMTGLWQVSGRSELTWDEGIRLDLEYIEQWSLMLDLVVLVRTARAVLARAGAH